MSGSISPAARRLSRRCSAELGGSPVGNSRATAQRTAPARTALAPRHEVVATIPRAAGQDHVLAPVGVPTETRPSAARTPCRSAPVSPPDPLKSCCALVQAAVETIRGIRPIGQLVRWVTPQVYDAVAKRAGLTVRVRGDLRDGHRTTIRHVRLCRLGERAFEASVVVDDGPRVRAVAVRMELHRDGWRAVALEIG